MKVIFVVDTLTNSGTEKSLLDILSNFSQSITPIIVYLNSPETLKQQFIDNHIETIKLEQNHSFFKSFVSLKKIIKKEKPKLIVSSLYKSNILCRAVALFSKPILIGTFVSDNYNKTRFCSFSFKQKIGHSFYKFIDRLSSNIPKYYISNSASIKYSNCKALGIKKQKVKVVYRGRNSEVIQEWSNPKNKEFTLIIIARVLENKGFSELIEAINILYHKQQKVKLIVYGDGVYKNQLQEKINKLKLENNIEFKGNILNAYEFLNTANCFILPTWYEGLSGSLIEAAISGIPIIASNISMNREVINGMSNTILHEVKNPESIANAIIEMINNYDFYKNNSSISRAKAIEKFDIKIIAKKYEDYLLSV